MGSIGYRWSEIFPQQRKAIEEILLQRIKEFKNIDLSGFLMGSIEIGYRWFDHVQIRNEIYQRIIELYGKDNQPHQDGRELANIIYAIGKGGAKKKNLPPEVITALLEGLIHRKSSMDAQNIANIFYR